jgi:hypothetical protein
MQEAKEDLVEEYYLLDYNIGLLVNCFRCGFLLGLFFDPEDGGDMFLRNVFDFQRTTRYYIPEDSTLHNHRRENLKFNNREERGLHEMFTVAGTVLVCFPKIGLYDLCAVFMSVNPSY